MDEENENPNLNPEFEQTNPDAPDFVKEIRKKPYFKKPDSTELDVPFSPFDHTTTQVPIDESLSAFGSKPEGAPKKEIGFLEGSLAQWEDKNESWRLLHGGWDRSEDYLDAYKDPNFNPLANTDKFLNVPTQYQPYLLAAENEPQQDFRLKRIRHEQWLDDTVKNGSWMQWLVGGGIGLGTDLINYVPVIGQMKYARWGKTAINSIMRSAPGALAYGVGSSLGEQVDKINGNVHDFMTDSLIRSTFATALFSASPLLSLAADKMELWKLQSYVGDAVKGIGYRLKIGEKGEVEGLQAYQRDGFSLSADKVQLAQDKADSAFYKGGIFKIPYIGTAAEKLMANPFFGSPAVSMLTSTFDSVRQVLDLAYDHGMVTKGLAEGKERPTPFFTKMQQTIAEIRQEQNIFNALHMKRNGVDSTNYVAQNLRRGGMYAKQKSLQMIDAEIGDKQYISPSQFASEVEEVMRTGTPHDNGAVNDAAAMFKKSMDEYYKDWRIAYNLPEDFLPPITGKQYLMRVYDTNFLNNNQTQWIDVISNELREQDKTINSYMQPINDISEKIESHVVTDKLSSDELEAMKANKKALQENLQNEIRSNPQLHLLAEDWHALSANESKELQAILKPRDIAQKKMDEIKEIVSNLQKNAGKSKQASNKGKTPETIQKHKSAKEESEQVLQQAKTDLEEARHLVEEEERKLQELAHSGQVNRRFLNKSPDSNIYRFKDPGERLKLRETYQQKTGYRVSEEEAHGFRKEHAKAYYDTIMNQTADDTINQIMGRFTGNGFENHTKSRTLMIHDDVLYKNNFMTKDLLSKVANYKMWLDRRTHLKNTYRNASIDGGFEPIIKDIHDQFDRKHTRLNEDKSNFVDKLKDKNLTKEQKDKLEKGLKQAEDEIKKNRKDFNRGKEQVQFAYEKMMGISKLDKRAKSIVSGIKAFNVFANLGFLPATMITDLSANGLKQGLIPFIQAGVYPAIQSLGGLLKTHDSESFRACFGALNLGLHHIGNSTASRQIDLATNPYLNLGRIPKWMDKTAHFTSNINLTTTIDNFLQQLTSSVAQSNVIRHMTAFSEGKLSKADRMWLNRYGLNPEKDSEAILNAFKKDGGGTNRMGGYQSNFWHWEDMEAANKVSDAVFRSTHDTIISANSLDAPIWLDENGLIGTMAPIIRGFKGWAFASLNRYLIPSLQQPDAQKLMGFALMSASAALVSPSRRMARGETPYREGQTAAQITAEILMDSPQFSWMSEALNDANLLSGGSLLSELKNDKYYDRTRMGIMGPTGSNFNKLFNFVDAMASGNLNQHDVNGMASMIPVINSLYGSAASHHLIEGFGLPKYRNK